MVIWKVYRGLLLRVFRVRRAWLLAMKISVL